MGINRGALNYIRLDSAGMHATFNPQIYRSSIVDSLFSNLAKHGFNLVRVFIDRNVHTGGMVESATDTALSSAYMNNVVDFLERAQKQNIYVMPTMELFPLGGRYLTQAYSVPAPANLDPVNFWYMHPGFIQAKIAFISDFLNAIKSRNPQALHAILAMDLDNEAAFNIAKPFTLDTGVFIGPKGLRYDLSKDKTAMADDIAQYQVNAYCDAIHAIVPGLPIDISMFTYGAVHRTGPGDFSLQAADWENRYPFRPTAMIASKADIIDLHLYWPNTNAITQDVGTVEFPDLKTLATTAGKPLLVGEFGVFKSWGLSSQAVDSLMATEPKILLRMGFAGWLYWTYDGYEQPDLISAADNGWDIFNILASTIPQSSSSQAPTQVLATGITADFTGTVHGQQLLLHIKLSTQGSVELVDLYGHSQRLFAQGFLGAGDHAFSLRNMPNGVYIIRLATNHSSSTSKVTILR